MKKIILVLAGMSCLSVNAQRFITKTGTTDFQSKAPLETIEGKNKATACLMDTKTGKIDFIIPIKSFVFDRQLLQEHFNENYMESDKFPKSTFSGRITNLTAIDFSKDGEYTAEVSGKLMIHGASKDIKQTGKLVVKGGQVTVLCNFSILLADYGISIPSAVKDKISKDVKINVNCVLDKMK